VQNPVTGQQERTAMGETQEIALGRHARGAPDVRRQVKVAESQ